MDNYREQWDTIQAGFVDRPDRAVRDADILVTRVMRDRGYPVDDFDQQAELLAADHPDLASSYREAHATSVRNEKAGATTEELRAALVHYRSIFDRLLEGSAPSVPGVDVDGADERVAGEEATDVLLHS